MTTATAKAPTPIGSVLQQTYRLERLIGHGGMGTVYEAAHLRLQRRFAIKMLSPHAAEDEEMLARFEREAEVTSGLGHPHIIEIIDFNRDHGASYIVMELLRGKDLEQRLSGGLRFGFEQAAAILEQTCSALHAAHERGVVHRDLKPSNVFLCERDDEQPWVKVLDFGISKVLGSATLAGESSDVLGSPGFMAPEQAVGRAADVDRRADVFAMGAILYRMLTGRRPFVAESVPGVLYQIVHEDPPQLKGPPAVVAAIMRALEKKPESRFATMLELSSAFCDAVQQARASAVRMAETRKLVDAEASAATLASGAVAPLSENVANDATLASGAVAPITEEAIDAGASTLSVSTSAIAALRQTPQAVPTELARPRPSPRAQVLFWTALLLLSVAGLAVLALAVFSGGSRGALRRIAVGGSLSELAKRLDKHLLEQPCDAEVTVLRSMLPLTSTKRRIALLGHLESCSLSASRKSWVQSLQANSADSETLADDQPVGLLVRAYSLQRLGRNTEALATVQRWRELTTATSEPLRRVATAVALTVLTDFDAEQVPQDLLEAFGRSAAVATIKAYRRLKTEGVDAARTELTKISGKARYEPAILAQGRVALAAADFDAARNAALRLVALGGFWALWGDLLLSDVEAARGALSEAAKILKKRALALQADAGWAAMAWMRRGDLCRVARRRRCAQESYRQAATRSHEAGDVTRVPVARLLAQVLSLPPGKALPEATQRLLARLRKSDSELASSGDVIAAWIALRQGRPIEAAKAFSKADRHTPSFVRFREAAADSWIKAGQVREAYALLEPITRNPLADTQVAAAIASLHLASKAAAMLGLTTQSVALARRLIRAWGHPESDLLRQAYWREGIKGSRYRVALFQRRKGVLYEAQVRVGLSATRDNKAAEQLIERLADRLRKRYAVTFLGRASGAKKSGQRTSAERGQDRPHAVVMATISASSKSVELRRQDGSPGEEVARVTLDLPAKPAEIARAERVLFPRSKDPLLYGRYVAARFEGCTHCMRRTIQHEALDASGAELTLSFSGDGRLLPSQFSRLVPNGDAELRSCLRGCIESLELPPFGMHPEDRLSVDVQVSVEPSWAMLRTVPRLHFVGSVPRIADKGN